MDVILVYIIIFLIIIIIFQFLDSDEYKLCENHLNIDGDTISKEAIQTILSVYNVTKGGTLSVPNVRCASTLHLGNKWTIKSDGDAHGNDGWLRLFGKNKSDYYGGLAAGQLYSKGEIWLHGQELKKQLDDIKSQINTVKKEYAKYGDRMFIKSAHKDYGNYKIKNEGGDGISFRDEWRPIQGSGGSVEEYDIKAFGIKLQKF